MTYSADFITQVIKSVKKQDMGSRKIYAFYDISKAALQRYPKYSSIKINRNKPPRKISNEALSKDVEQYPDILYLRVSTEFRLY